MPNSPVIKNIASQELFSSEAPAPLPTRADPYFPSILKLKKTIQLAASGPVKITELERKIIDTEEFQRLRAIKQLGAAFWVYPTALHTRFDHSLGTLQMVAEMIAKIRNNDHCSEEQSSITRRQELIARLYALLHDITHVPFGHTLEDELGLLVRHDNNTERIQRFLGSGSTIGKIIIKELGTEGTTILRELLGIYTWDEVATPTDFHPEDAFIHDLVSNTVCADLLDYIRRDDYFCNLGVAIKYHFLDYLFLETDPKSRLKRVVIRLWKDSRIPRRDLLTDLCGLLWARYKLAERVYFHHGKTNASAILGRALQEHFRNESGKDIEDWIVHQSDDSVLAELSESKKSPLARDLCQCLRRRQFYARLRPIYSLEDLGGRQSVDYSINIDARIESTLLDPDRRRQFEDLLAELALASPGDVLIYAPTRMMNLKAALMRVQWKGQTRLFKEIDDPIVKPQLDLILESHKHLWKLRILCRASLSASQRKRVIDAFETEMLTLDPAQQQLKREELCRGIVELGLIESQINTGCDELIRRERVGNVVKEIITLMNHHTSEKRRTLKETLAQSLQKNWPRSEPEPA